jgi:hypothetical protein
MATPIKSCVICGDGATVRSHLFPRALVHRIRGNEKSVVEGDRSRPGVKLSQSGLWDDGFLCERHEKALSTADDYMARFCRRFEKVGVLSSTGNSYTAPNPRPELLLRFAAATIWRHAVSSHGIDHKLELGPYQGLIESHLFEGAALPLEILVGRSNIVGADGHRIEIGLAPYKRRLLDWTVWHFTIAGFDFYVKTDKRPFPEPWKPFLANDNDPITLALIDPRRLDEIPMLRPIFAQMFREA